MCSDDHNPNTTSYSIIEQSSTMSKVNVASKDLDSIESKFPQINGMDWGSMRLCQFGTCSDGVERSCAKMSVKKGFVWTQCMPASKGGPMPKGVNSCPKAHFGYMEKGEMKVIMDSGEEKIIRGGEAYYVAPGHDAVVLEDSTMIEFESKAAEFYGKLDSEDSPVAETAGQ
mmetsp:Transcript_34057/g.77857  ORF Transcript_34057/g.77857 Transcript_34057/m.77857 type:complete len:171 (-) Transcript_34057:182-694(-)